MTDTMIGLMIADAALAAVVMLSVVATAIYARRMSKTLEEMRQLSQRSLDVSTMVERAVRVEAELSRKHWADSIAAE